MRRWGNAVNICTCQDYIVCQYTKTLEHGEIQRSLAIKSFLDHAMTGFQRCRRMLATDTIALLPRTKLSPSILPPIANELRYVTVLWIYG